jgi:IS30 family transposase
MYKRYRKKAHAKDSRGLILWLHTMTSDNGKEFTNQQQLSQKFGTDYFFAKPYPSWERGGNENLNGLVRQYFPKTTNL